MYAHGSIRKCEDDVLRDVTVVFKS